MRGESHLWYFDLSTEFDVFGPRNLLGNLRRGHLPANMFIWCDHGVPYMFSSEYVQRVWSDLRSKRNLHSHRDLFSEYDLSRELDLCDRDVHSECNLRRHQHLCPDMRGPVNMRRDINVYGNAVV
jgi:hypothetical protein